MLPMIPVAMMVACCGVVSPVWTAGANVAAGGHGFGDAWESQGARDGEVEPEKRTIRAVQGPH